MGRSIHDKLSPYGQFEFVLLAPKYRRQPIESKNQVIRWVQGEAIQVVMPCQRAPILTQYFLKCVASIRELVSHEPERLLRLWRGFIRSVFQKTGKKIGVGLIRNDLLGILAGLHPLAMRSSSLS